MCHLNLFIINIPIHPHSFHTLKKNKDKNMCAKVIFVLNFNCKKTTNTKSKMTKSYVTGTTVNLQVRSNGAWSSASPRHSTRWSWPGLRLEGARHLSEPLCHINPLGSNWKLWLASLETHVLRESAVGEKERHKVECFIPPPVFITQPYMNTHTHTHKIKSVMHIASTCSTKPKQLIKTVTLFLQWDPWICE